MNNRTNNNVLVITPGFNTFFIENKGTIILYGLLLIACGYEVQVVGLMGLGAALFLTLFLLYRWWYLSSVKWTITRNQLKSEEGVFTKDIQYVELYRVVDYSEQQSLLQMMFGLKDIIIYSGDRTTPATRIYGVAATIEVIPILKQLVEEQKKEHKIYEITNR